MLQDYSIRGLDASTIKTTIVGTGHFIQNMIPAWYKICQVELTEHHCNLTFMPSSALPSELRVETEYSLSVRPHTAFEMVFSEEDEDDQSGHTIRFVFLHCEENDEGRPIFRYEVLQKTTSLLPVVKKPSCAVAQKSSLLLAGFEKIASGDNREYHMSIIDAA